MQRRDEEHHPYSAAGDRALCTGSPPQPDVSSCAQCDLAVASHNAKFAVSGINVGLFCSTPSVPLARNVLRKQAMEMLLTGDFIDADSAVQRGLINRAVPARISSTRGRRASRQDHRKSSVAVTTGKKMFYKQIEMGLEGAYQYAAEVMACNMMAEDVGEGIDRIRAEAAAGVEGQ
jgi:enoyl-CoA hydratase/carnithine racemase